MSFANKKRKFTFKEKLIGYIAYFICLIVEEYDDIISKLKSKESK